MLYVTARCHNSYMKNDSPHSDECDIVMTDRGDERQCIPPVKMLGDSSVDALVFGAKMLIDDQIMAQNRNSRWRLSAMWDFPKFDFCPVGLLRPLIFHGYQIWCKNVDRREIMAKNLNSRWRPSAILELLYHRIGPPT